LAIRAVIFDIGGVLNKVESIGAPGKWWKRLGLNDKELIHAIFDGPLSASASVGQVSTEEVWRSVAQQLGLSPAEARDLERDAWAAYAWNTELLDYVRSLHPRYKTAILSNAWPNAREQCKGYVNSELFDVMIFSAEVGMKKPDPAIFWLALDRLGVAAQEAIFVDDKQRYADAADALGLHGIAYTNNADCCAEINRLLSRT
jgi:epoxide hydrolase-like predicted phosphatase